MIVAGVRDTLTYSIPNWISLLLFCAFIGCGLINQVHWSLFAEHFVCGFTILVVSICAFALNWMGGGDAKLLAAAALWIGFDHLLPFLFWTAMLGGLLALAILIYRSVLPPVWVLGQSWAKRLHDPKEGIPYGVAIAGGGLLVYPQTIWMTGIAS